ncbi:alpha-N-arabinofuranosidase [Tangfeifania diversioriginum]|uniref:non-reducing end alpha-L-arabinofuranosidase n=1 Tax=Tangfeifania diversioriginum TaxID=1168035 RepID=A0A1M6E9R1_9BACT|nr:alpha-N-arabinofuranosidase [Tangfeifania diversioriginum]SHI82185.1 alpha-N-arabinofuranosidase [Tangfeifania diversioriginum]
MNFKRLILPVFLLVALSATAQNKIVVNTDLGKEKISRHIYGHFSEHLGRCIYGGYWVGEDSDIPNTNGIRNDVVDALREMGIPNLRWPGGCFADEYHWMDGIGPRDERPTMINTHWGGVTENNHFGTHEFLELCNQLDTEPVICGNLGSGTVQEMSQWVEYLNSGNISPMTDLRKSNGREEPWGVKYWGVGNENWGCGGNMTAEYYANEMKRYSTYTKNYGDNRLYRVACGPSGADYHWMETLMRDGAPGRSFQGISLHYYTVAHSWGDKGSATDFDENDYFLTMSKTLFMDELLRNHINIMDRYDPRNRVGLIVDEWGNWHNVEPGTNPGFLYQQNTLRDAMVASVNLDLFNNYCRRVKMANIAQTVNVLQAMILTKDDEIVKTPSYYVFKMYKVHYDATLLPTDVESEFYSHDGERIPAISTSASKSEDGTIHITISNIDPNEALDLTCELRGLENVSFERGEIITGEKVNSYNDFGEAEEVSSASFSDVKVNGNQLEVNLPAKSIVMLELR